MAKIATHKDLRVYQLAFVKAMEIYTISKLFPVVPVKISNFPFGVKVPIPTLPPDKIVILAFAGLTAPKPKSTPIELSFEKIFP